MNDEFLKKLMNENCFSDILGQKEAKKQLRSALMMKRHVIIVGAPGIGKTTLAKNVAKLLPEITEKGKKVTGIQRFIRIQGSPDLTSEDLLGDIDPIKALEFGSSSKEAFTPGKVFRAENGILFFDELNRCPAKLQNALLQVLEEGRATIGSYDVDFPVNFIFIGTLNPNDSTTESLSQVFMDRCDIVYMGYPESLEIEKEIVTSKGKKIAEFDDELLDRTISFVRSLRDSRKLERFPSVRASIGLYERAQANAILAGRNEVILEDVTDAIVSVLAHRIELKPSAKYAETIDEFLRQEIADKLGAASGDYR